MDPDVAAPNDSEGGSGVGEGKEQKEPERFVNMVELSCELM